MDIGELTLNELRALLAEAEKLGFCTVGTAPHPVTKSAEAAAGNSVGPATPKQTNHPVIVCTEGRNVFFGYTEDDTGSTILLTRARQAIYWATTGGIGELAEVGPNPKSRVGSPVTCVLHRVQTVYSVSPKAAEAWNAAPTWGTK